MRTKSVLLLKFKVWLGVNGWKATVNCLLIKHLQTKTHDNNTHASKGRLFNLQKTSWLLWRISALFITIFLSCRWGQVVQAHPHLPCPASSALLALLAPLALSRLLARAVDRLAMLIILDLPLFRNTSLETSYGPMVSTLCLISAPALVEQRDKVDPRTNSWVDDCPLPIMQPGILWINSVSSHLALSLSVPLSNYHRIEDISCPKVPSAWQ